MSLFYYYSFVLLIYELLSPTLELGVGIEIKLNKKFCNFVLFECLPDTQKCIITSKQGTRDSSSEGKLFYSKFPIFQSSTMFVCPSRPNEL